MEHFLQYFLNFFSLKQNEWWLLLAYLFCAYLIFLVTKSLLLRFIKKVVLKTRAKWDDALFEKKCLTRWLI